jgi:hypothetical protein
LLCNFEPKQGELKRTISTVIFKEKKTLWSIVIHMAAGNNRKLHIRDCRANKHNTIPSLTDDAHKLLLVEPLH